MKAKFNIAILCLCLICFCSCKKKCPAFPEHLVDYFPYEVGQKITFTNQTNDSLIFGIQNINKTEEYSCSASFWDKCHCGVSYDVNAGILSTNISTPLSFEYTILEVNINHSPFNKTVNKNSLDPNNSSLFGDTVNLGNNTNLEFTRVKIIKGLGITEFYNAETDELWTLSE